MVWNERLAFGTTVITHSWKFCFGKLLNMFLGNKLGNPKSCQLLVQIMILDVAG